MCAARGAGQPRRSSDDWHASRHALERRQHSNRSALVLAVALGGPDHNSEQAADRQLTSRSLASRKWPSPSRCSGRSSRLATTVRLRSSSPPWDRRSPRRLGRHSRRSGFIRRRTASILRSGLRTAKRDRDSGPAPSASRTSTCTSAARITTAVQGIPGETPAIVVGSAVNAPLSPTSRARVARELHRHRARNAR